ALVQEGLISEGSRSVRCEGRRKEFVCLFIPRDTSRSGRGATEAEFDRFYRALLLGSPGSPTTTGWGLTRRWAARRSRWWVVTVALCRVRQPAEGNCPPAGGSAYQARFKRI